MLEIGATKKNKISLSDYNHRKDIENRLLLASFSTLDLAVLEEILFSPLQLPVQKIAKALDESEKQVRAVLEKLAATGLLSMQGDTITVDKESRKYFEVEAAKFDPDFKPDMDFLQHLLRKVQIHVLPTWYAIPRTSNNIFDSLVEIYLATPHLFQRYLMEMNMGDPTVSAIAQDVFRAPDFRIPAADLMHKYDLSRAQFEEAMLLLEFHFVCCLSFERDGSHWKEIVTPFHEWREYLLFLRDTTPKPITDTGAIERKRPQDFAFIQDMTALLQHIKKQPLALSIKGYAALTKISDNPSYIERLVRRLVHVQLAEKKSDKLYPSPAAEEWMEDRLEGRALPWLPRAPPSAVPEKTIREAEKSITRGPLLRLGAV